MRHDAPFLVMRLAPPMGRSHLPRRVSVAHQAYSLAAALDVARDEQRLSGHVLNAADLWRLRSVFWIERRGASARQPTRR